MGHSVCNQYVLKLEYSLGVLITIPYLYCSRTRARTFEHDHRLRANEAGLGQMQSDLLQKCCYFTLASIRLIRTQSGILPKHPGPKQNVIFVVLNNSDDKSSNE